MCFAPQTVVHFFDVSTSKSALRMMCFDTLDLKTCFAPQRRVFFRISIFFRHLNFQKWSETEVFCHFLLAEMCFAPQRRAIFHFSSAHVSAPAALASLLFDPPEPQTLEKQQCFATFLPFRAPASSLFWHLSPSLIFSLLTFSTSEFLPGSASSWLCFLSVYIVGKFHF